MYQSLTSAYRSATFFMFWMFGFIAGLEKRCRERGEERKIGGRGG